MKLAKCQLCGKELRADNRIGYCRKHRNQSKERKDYMQKYTTEHFDEVKENKKRWRVNNKDKLSDLQRERLENPSIKIGHKIRVHLNRVIRSNWKQGWIFEVLGCNRETFLKHVESKFQDGMSWENYGEWELDHIKPLIRHDLTEPESLKIIGRYDNIQPLWAVENRKKSARI